MVNLLIGTLPTGINAGSPASATVTLMNVEEGMDSCEHIWCATAVLKWFAQPTSDTMAVPYLACAPACPGSSLTSDSSTFDGYSYVAAIRDIRQTSHHWSRFRFSLSTRDPETGRSIGPTEEQVRSWTLYINDDIQLPLSSAAKFIGETDFVWYGETYYHFKEDMVLEMRIEANGDDTASILLSSTTPVDEGNNYGRPYTVKLSHQPYEEVTVTISGHAGTDVTTDKSTLTFTTENWRTAQTVKVRARQDADATDDLVTLVHSGKGGEYDGVEANLEVRVIDDEPAPLVLSEINPTMEEGDATGLTYTVKLSHQPSEEVTVNVSGQDGTDLTLTGLSSANTLTFSTSNWNTAQTVNVSAAQDSDANNDVVILLHTVAGDGLDGASSDLVITVLDDEAVSTAPDESGDAPVENTAATGLPTISGDPAVGETLTTETSDIEDVNGLTNAGFAFQWSRYDGSASGEIAGATSSSYTVTDNDVGYEIEVRVSFTDDAGFEETTTSNTVYVQPPPPLYGAFDAATVPKNHDGTLAFTLELHFSEEPELSHINVRDHVLTVTNGDVTNAARRTPGSDIRWVITVQPDGNDNVVIVLPVTENCDADGGICTGDRRPLSNRLEVTVAGSNTPATGAPTISGTPQADRGM